MSSFKSRLRWLRFRLRSLLMLTLAVALWLRWEVRQSDLIGGHVAAIRDMGGEVEFESSPWSLLRHVDSSIYGRHAVLVEIPIDWAGGALRHLEKLPGLREVRLAMCRRRRLGSRNGRLLVSLPLCCGIPRLWLPAQGVPPIVS